jgi:hypothetical protein
LVETFSKAEVKERGREIGYRLVETISEV